MSSTWTPKFKNYEFWMEQILLQDICPMGNSCSLLAFFSFFFFFVPFVLEFFLFIYFLFPLYFWIIYWFVRIILVQGHC